MKVLVVGGTGLIGGHCAVLLQAQGHAVTVAARSRPGQDTPMASMPVLLGNYIEQGFPEEQLADFDTVVFCAGNDVRHVPEGADLEQRSLWDRVNSQAVPAFAARARAAGVKTFVNVGSFYPQVAPQLIEDNAYVRSRHLADAGVRELATSSFHACSVNAPFVVGTLPGLSLPLFEAYVAYAQGNMGDMPVYAPAGGSNFMSSLSLAEAVSGAIHNGEPGTAYLVGDENLAFAEYFGLFFDAAGRAQAVAALDQEHPLLPDVAIVTGRGSVVSYEPDATQSALLGYRRNDVRRAVREIVDQIAA